MTTSAAEAKEKGNQAFKAGQWAEAIGHYTRAIVLSTPATLSATSPTQAVDPTYYLNRAAAYLKLDKYDDAVRDCTSALQVRKGDVKALFRRAQARAGLDDKQGAITDLEEALKLEPRNDAVKKDLERLRALKREAESKPKRRLPIALAETVKERVPPAAKAPAVKAEAAPRRRRIPIEIVEPSPAESSMSQAAPSSTSDDLLKAVSTTRLKGSSASASTSRTPPPSFAPVTTTAPPPSTFLAAREAREAKRRTVGGGVFKRDGSSRIIGSDGKDLIQADANGSFPRPKAPAVLLEKEPPLPLAPRRASEFSIMFKDLPESRRWAYLQQIPPATLPVLFGAALDPDILTSIVDALSLVPSNSRQEVLDYLSFLPKVSRFSTNRMFLSSQTSALVKRLLDECGAGEGDRKAWGV